MLITRFALALLIASTLCGAASAQTTARELAVDVAASRIYVVTHRTGLLSFLGHEHAILAHQWRASVCWDGPAHAASNATVDIDAASLSIDADSARTLAGIGRGPSAGQRAQIHQKMQASLEVTKFPNISFRSDSVRPRAGGISLFGHLTIKDATRPVEIPVAIAEVQSQLRLRGAVTFRQSTFDIRPESIAGVVKVADPVNLHVLLVGHLTSNTCR
jgi:polyisoprenoid-binding protein YceI